MKAEYKRDLNENYLILCELEETEEDDYSIYMVEKNKIAGLLPVHRARRDGQLLLKYEITGKQPLAGLYERKAMRCENIVSVLSELSEVLERMQKYLLSPDCLVFHPEYMFLDPDGKKLQICYAPGIKNEFGISLLAEFILRRLDHQDSAAVAVGYRFYGMTMEENFSLQKSLKELLLDERKETEAEAKERSTEVKERTDSENDINQKQAQENYGKRAEIEDYAERRDFDRGRPSFETEKILEEKKLRKERRTQLSPEFEQEEETPQIIHKVRKSREKEGTVAARIFSVVHPAVLLSGLFLLALLEGIYYFGYLQLTEAGGIFFLILSAELLLNNSWRKWKEQKDAPKFTEWEDEEEEYQELVTEMYEKERYEKERRKEPDAEIGETCCLTDLRIEETLRLIAVKMPGEWNFPDIVVRKNSVTVGKMKTQCEAVLDAPAVSRLHARLDYRQGNYYLKDLNSRNGTFLNGERLMPQEAKQITSGDRIAFANVQYRAVRE